MKLFEKCFAYDEPEIVRKRGLYPYFTPIEGSSGSQVTCYGKPHIMIGSNNYLGLTHHPEVKEAAKRAIDKYGSGCTGSRFLNGNLDLHEELEVKLAEFVGKETALLFSTGFLTNLGTISCLAEAEDVIFSDEENHASLIEGCRLSRARVVTYLHNDMNDLEKKLKKHAGIKGKIIITDGVFSMGGDIVRLPELVTLAKRYGALVYVDDAHGLGVLGRQGRGTVNHFGLDREVDLIMGTFSKSFASLGGFLAGPAKVIDYVKHKCRPFMFSASIPPASAATVLTALRLMQEDPTMIASLWRNTEKMHSGFKKLGYNTGRSETPIIPVILGKDQLAFIFTKRLSERGIFATPAVSPAVPKEKALIRTSYMSTQSEQELDQVLQSFAQIGAEFGVI
ncbi:MAG: pyridoxal phosphate-dependent aminotransferase family protein [Deltaproteobacteria bacterium]|nr:pyridoxal phosphate-dependent aminotransferase family protein [Deltaproteobacteria bacterium]